MRTRNIFAEVLGKNLYLAISVCFTVGSAIYAMYSAMPWVIGVCFSCVVVFCLSACFEFYKEYDGSRLESSSYKQQLSEATEALNNQASIQLNRIEKAAALYSLSELIRSIEVTSRLQQLSNEFFNLRKISRNRVTGEYVLFVKVDSTTFAAVKMNDEFVLEFRDKNGLISRVANGHIVKTITPDGLLHVLLWLESNYSATIDGLCNTTEKVPKGYLLRPVCLPIDRSKEEIHCTVSVLKNIKEIADGN